MCLCLENDILSLVPVEPTDLATVDFEMVLSHGMGCSNSVEDGVGVLSLDEVHPCRDSNSNLGFGLELGALETNVCAPEVGYVATVTVWDLSNKSTGGHQGIVVEARLV